MDCELLAKYHIRHPFVDAFYIARKEGIKVTLGEFLEEDSNADGAIIDGGIAIRFDLDPSQQLYVCAHELGHLKMGHDVGEGRGLYIGDQCYGGERMEEEAANEFALNLLMPKKMLTEEFYRMPRCISFRLELLADVFAVEIFHLKEQLYAFHLI